MWVERDDDVNWGPALEVELSERQRSICAGSFSLNAQDMQEAGNSTQVSSVSGRNNDLSCHSFFPAR